MPNNRKSTATKVNTNTTNPKTIFLLILSKFEVLTIFSLPIGKGTCSRWLLSTAATVQLNGGVLCSHLAASRSGFQPLAVGAPGLSTRVGGLA